MFKKVMKLFLCLVSCFELQNCSEDLSRRFVVCEAPEGLFVSMSDVTSVNSQVTSRKSIRPRARRRSLSSEDENGVTVLNSYDCEISALDMMKTKLLLECDEGIVNYWTQSDKLERMELHEKPLGFGMYTILDEVVRADNLLHVTRPQVIEELLRVRMQKVISSIVCKESGEQSFLAYLKANQGSFVCNLWLEHLYTQRDAIHKNKINKSYLAWPITKEIATLRGFKDPAFHKGVVAPKFPIPLELRSRVIDESQQK